jgi:hypothetical protein
MTTPLSFTIQQTLAAARYDIVDVDIAGGRIAAIASQIDLIGTLVDRHNKLERGTDFNAIVFVDNSITVRLSADH